MSQIAGVAETDSAGRASYLSRIASQLRILPSQETKNWNHGIVDLACAAAKNAPVSYATSENGAGAFVLSRWSEEKLGGVSQAIRVLKACNADGGVAVARFASFGLACYVETSGTLWLGVDTLGLFPLYYSADAERLVFSTSPAMVQAHEKLKREFNIRGFVGNLLTMHMVGNQTLWKGVRRVAPGHALRWKAGDGAREIPVNVLTPGEAHFGESYDQSLNRIDEVFTNAVNTDAVENTTAMLLSGGLDSRLLAAYLHRTLKSPVQCITLGNARDLEMRIAGRVARELSWPQHPADVDPSRYLAFADLHLFHQQLGNGFNDLAFWYAGETAAEHQATCLYTGVMGDTVMGGLHIPWGFDLKRQAFSYDTIFAKLNRYGFRPDQIRQLVRPEVLGDRLDAVLTDFRDLYDNCPGLPFQKLWLFDLYNRNRFHLASLGWKSGAGAWPVLAFAGAEMLQLFANLPANAFMERRAQIDLLLRHAPNLAHLPLDRNSRTDLAPVRYRSRWHKRWDEKIMGPYRRYLRKRHDRQGVETRYYYRVYDINNPGWQAIRRAAEPYRKIAETFLQPEVLRQHLPPPDTTIKFGDGIVDAAKTKTLIGFMLWAGKNLSA